MSIDSVSMTPSAGTLQALMLSQYKDSENLNKLIGILANRHDVVDDVLLSMKTAFLVDSAEGAQLDILGRLFLVTRGTMDDTALKAAIKVKAALRSFSTPEDIISVVKGIWGATTVTYVPEYPAACAILSDASEISQSDLEAISPAGIQVRGASFLVDFDGNNIVDYNENLIYGVS